LVAPADAQIMYTLNDVHFPSVGSGYGVLYQPGAIVVTREWMDHCFPGATRLDVKAIAFSKKQMPSQVAQCSYDVRAGVLVQNREEQHIVRARQTDDDGDGFQLHVTPADTRGEVNKTPTGALSVTASPDIEGGDFFAGF